MNCNLATYLVIHVSYLVMKGPQWKYVNTVSCAIRGIIIYVTSLSVKHTFILPNKSNQNNIKLNQLASQQKMHRFRVGIILRRHNKNYCIVLYCIVL